MTAQMHAPRITVTITKEQMAEIFEALSEGPARKHLEDEIRWQNEAQGYD